MATVPLIIQRVQFELRDMGQQWCDSDLVTDVLQIKNDDLEQELQSLDLNFDTQVLIIPNVPAQTTDLSSYQQPGQPLANLILPQVIEWRLAGENQEEWEIVPQVQKVVDTDTGTGEVGANVSSDSVEVESWEWRGGIINISPSNSVVDLRIRFQALPTDLNADSPNQPIRGVVNILVYWICWSIAKSRGTTEQITGWKEELVRAKNNFINNNIKGKYGQLQRLGGRRSGIPQGIGIWRPPTQ